MPLLARKRRLRKELRLFDVYAIATGTTLSAGFFLLPGLAATQAGPALIAAYLLAAVPLVPAMFSVVELATAMPRAGGVYYFLDRSLGPLVGTIGGLGTWLALMLKVAFALVGMGAYLALFVPDLPVKAVAIGLAVALGLLNLFGAGKSGRFQVFLVLGLLLILVDFIGEGLPRVRAAHFRGFFDAGFEALASTAGLVYISYVGVTKVASLSEEVKDPERNLPLGVFLALGSAILIYCLGTVVMVGVVPMETLRGDLTPVATAAELAIGRHGVALVCAAAFLAFTSVANAGTLSASRYPLAMSRDRLLPRAFRRLARGRTPALAIVTTMGLIVLILAFLDPTKIAKLASAFQLLMFALVCLAVIIMRESHIQSYDPGYRSPFYPWMQIVGITVPLVLIAEMGAMALLFTLGLITASALWYFYYARRRVVRGGALYHMLARFAQPRLDPGLDRELRQILKEKGLREEDPFDHVVAHAAVVDLEPHTSFEEVVDQVSSILARRLPATPEELIEKFLQGTRMGATPVTGGISLPHLRLAGADGPEMVMARSRSGLAVEVHEPGEPSSPDGPIHALFFLVSPEDDPRQHLRILAQIAERVDDEDFLPSWLAARHEPALKEILLRDERFLSLKLRSGTRTASLIGRPLRDLSLPEETLIAMIRRHGRILVPRGHTMLQEDDRITIIGSPPSVRQLEDQYGDGG